MTEHHQALYRACSPSPAYQAWFGFFLNCALVLWCAAWLTLISVDEAPTWPWLVALLPLGLFLADLFSGLNPHWATDTWLDETQWCRVVCIARERRISVHHIVDYGVRDYLGYSGWPTALLIGPVAILLTLALQPSLPAYVAVFLCLEVALCMVWGTYAHRLGHAPVRSPVIRTLQRLRLRDLAELPQGSPQREPRCPVLRDKRVGECAVRSHRILARSGDAGKRRHRGRTSTQRRGMVPAIQPGPILHD